MTENIEKPATEAVDLDHLVLWRDLQIGEILELGDRIMQPDMAWAIYNSRPREIDKNTCPCQRRIFHSQNAKDDPQESENEQ